MPQMAPSMWLNIMILTSTSIMMMNSLIYFSNNNLTMKIKHLNKLNKNWKW